MQDVFIIGGIRNEKYRQLNNALCSIKEDFSTIIPPPPETNSDDLHNFIKCIKYVYLIMNINTNDDNDKDDYPERRSSEVISDIIVISDRTSQSKLL